MRRGPAMLLAIGLALAGVLAIAGPVSAHNQIVSSTPSPNETLTALPSEFSIVTNNVLLDIGGTGRGFAFEIQDAHGRFYQTGCVSIVDDTMSTAAQLGAAGTYTIVYQLVSADGHTVSGKIPFTWAPSGSGSAVTRGVSSPPGCDGAPAPPKPDASSGGSEASRDSTIPVADLLWIGGVVLVVAIAVIVTAVVLLRRRRDETDDDQGAEGRPGGPTPSS